MKVLLTALNAKYIHSSLSIRYLKAYAKKEQKEVLIKEFTINHQTDFILREIYKINPKILAFSCYIWNIEQIKEIIREYKKIVPDTKIILGGPEVSYNSEEIMKDYDEIDVIIKGEGEKTFCELLEYFIDKNRNLSEIMGITYKQDEKIMSNHQGQAIDLNEIPFPYENQLDNFKNKIIYYETMRGCPFNCQYCLSSIEKGIRFLSLNRVYFDLKKFLDAEVVQVKFVDRTFNCNKKHALSIWKYLSENDNGITNFHFELSAVLLDEEMIQFLKTVRLGLFQFEIGVQSTNIQTIEYIKRKMNFEDIKRIVLKIKEGKNIHQHLDLIAGLPGEDYNSFAKSFDDVYTLKPQQFQLGFLKILKGSGLHRDYKKYGLIHKEKAPYEVLYTNELSYQDVLKLKMIEEMVEVYYNSGRFMNSIKYIEGYFDSPFKFYEQLAIYWEKNNYHQIQHNKLAYYTHLLEFFKLNINQSCEQLKWIMKYDIYMHEKAKKIPEWMPKEISEDVKMKIRSFYQKEENINKYVPELIDYTPKQISRKVHIEVFPFDIVAWTENRVFVEEKIDTAVLFNYYEKDYINNTAKVYKINI